MNNNNIGGMNKMSKYIGKTYNDNIELIKNDYIRAYQNKVGYHNNIRILVDENDVIVKYFFG
jgi:hypothetical protein